MKRWVGTSYKSRSKDTKLCVLYPVVQKKQSVCHQDFHVGGLSRWHSLVGSSLLLYQNLPYQTANLHVSLDGNTFKRCIWWNNGELSGLFSNLQRIGKWARLTNSQRWWWTLSTFKLQWAECLSISSIAVWKTTSLFSLYHDFVIVHALNYLLIFLLISNEQLRETKNNKINKWRTFCFILVITVDLTNICKRIILKLIDE